MFKSLLPTGLLAAACLIGGMGEAAAAKTLPMPPRAKPGQQQPVFGAKDGFFTFDDQPAIIISGSIHYPRIPKEYWRDRIQKAKAMGFNTIDTYIFWNIHEKKPGEFDFSGNLDVAEFIRICQEEGMWVIVRPGPYVCSEWTFGGLPAWLLADEDLEVRSNDPRFLEATERYLNAVGKELKDLQINKGGPIIQVQVENEYGQFGRPGHPDDIAYNQAIHDQLRGAGFDTMLVRSDWPVDRTIGTAEIDGVYTTMNFGGSAAKAFEFFRNRYPGMPAMCGEYWVGWFDHWGSKHHTKALEPFIKEIIWMLDNDVSFNVYMLHGGTNFGFTSGANWSSGQYSADTTSYDYDSPLDETGRITEKFFMFRDTIKPFLPEGYDLPEPPAQIKRIEVPTFTLTQSADFEQLLKDPKSFEQPPHLEAMGQYQGLALYKTTVDVAKAGPQRIAFTALKDRAIIMVNGKRVATLDRRMRQDNTVIELPAGKVQLDILLENMGHLNYSREMMRDRKGLGEVSLDGKPVRNWQVYNVPLELEDVAALKFKSGTESDSVLPVFYKGEFTVDEIGDTLLDMGAFGKGMIWVNGVNLGRFWDIGPQRTLFMPGSWMRKGKNEVVVMDIEPTGKTSINGVTEPIYELKIDPNLSYTRKPGEKVRLKKNEVIAEGSFALGDEAQLVDFGKNVKARYIAVESLNSHSDDEHATIAELDLIDDKGNWLNRDGWKVIYADSEEIVAEPGGAANVIDHQPVTYWHTRYHGKGANTKHPHQIVIDLGEAKDFRTLRYLPRNGANPGKIKDYKIYASQKRFDGLKD